MAPAILSYKRKTIVPWADRKKLVEALKGVELVVPQTTLDYEPNLRWLRPAFVVHGNDWNVPGSPQYVARQKVIDTLAEWRGQLIEPPYTGGISTSEIIQVHVVTQPCPEPPAFSDSCEPRDRRSRIRVRNPLANPKTSSSRRTTYGCQCTTKSTEAARSREGSLSLPGLQWRN